MEQLLIELLEHGPAGLLAALMLGQSIMHRGDRKAEADAHRADMAAQRERTSILIERLALAHLQTETTTTADERTETDEGADR